jgi:hypothetical protein
MSSGRPNVVGYDYNTKKLTTTNGPISDLCSSGTYEPTITPLNSSIFSANDNRYPHLWSRVGDIVTVSGGCLLQTPEAALEFGEIITVDLPIPATRVDGNQHMLFGAATFYWSETLVDSSNATWAGIVQVVYAGNPVTQFTVRSAHLTEAGASGIPMNILEANVEGRVSWILQYKITRVDP